MLSPTRFQCPSAPLALKALLQRTRRKLWIGLALAVVAHGALTQLRGWTRHQKTTKPLTTHFVKREPRLTKPLELKKLPRPRQRQVRRTMVSVQARLRRADTASFEQAARVVASLARPGVRFARVVPIEASSVEPTALAQAVEGAKEVAQRIDMSLELLDIEALNTGEYHAMVVQDPEDKRSIKGFCRLGIVYSANLYEQYNPGHFESHILPGFLRLVQAMNRLTDIDTDVLGRIAPDHAELLRTPWVYICAYYAFELSPSELDGLGKYLTAGGFLFADAMQGTPCVRPLVGTILQALEMQGIPGPRFERLPNSHPMYHCYFDFTGPPAASDRPGWTSMPDPGALPYLECVHVGDRLSAILSKKWYCLAWTFWGLDRPGTGGVDLKEDPERCFQFGVNTIIFALTQEGSITHRLMESIH